MGQAACSVFPSQGPTALDVTDIAHSTPSEQQDGYVVVDLDSRVSHILEGREQESFRGLFGDYRPAQVSSIGVGDSVSVTIWEAAAGGLFSAPVVDHNTPGSHTATIPNQVVDRDGAITVPYAGRVKVVGLTPPQVEERIVKALAGKAVEPQALVAISRNIANTVTISGEVVNGARVPLSPRGDRLLDVIATAGGIRSPVQETFITLTRSGRSVTVPMQALLAFPKENIMARSGDTLTLVRDPQSFTAFGATGRNALITFDAKGITLEEAVAKAGGLIDSLSDPGGVFLLRSEPESLVRQLDPHFPMKPDQRVANVVYRINLRDPNTYFLAQHFEIRKKDMVYVATALSTEWQKFLALTNLSATTTFVTSRAVPAL